MTVDDLRAFVDGLGSHDLSVAVGLCELIRRADADGVAERGVWMASVRDALEELAEELGSHGAGMLGSEGEAFGRFLESRVIEGLERAGIAARNGDGSAWTGLTLDAALWKEVGPGREEVLDGVRDAIRSLEEARARAFEVSPSDAVVLEDGSRLTAPRSTAAGRWWPRWMCPFGRGRSWGSSARTGQGRPPPST